MNNRQSELIVISGASSGIGLAMVKAVLNAGYSVLGISRHFDDEIRSHPNLQLARIDLADTEALPARLTELVDSIEAPVRALVNNAGMGKMGYLEQLSYDDLKVTMDLNFLSHAMMSKAFLPHMKKQRYGDIVFVGSEAALKGARQGTAYCASKFALRGFSQALRQECARSGVRVTLLNPAATRTAFFDDLFYEPGAAPENAIEADDIGQLLLALLQMRATTVIDEINLSPLTQVWERKS